MKLKCQKHRRRVLVLEASVVHRDDGSECGDDYTVVESTQLRPMTAMTLRGLLATRRTP